MHLEEQPLQTVVSGDPPSEGAASAAAASSSSSATASSPFSSSSADLLVSCYSIIESAVAYMASDRFDPLLDDRQKGQVRPCERSKFGQFQLT